MMRKMAFALAALLALAMTATALALPVRFEEGGFSAQAIDLADGSAYTMNTQLLQVLGRDAEGRCVVYADGRFGAVEMADIADTLSAANIYPSGLTSVEDLETLSKGARGQEVTALQMALKAMGYLDGTADGSFGSQSERAISAFQEALGMEQTGEADPLLQLLAASMAREARIITKPIDPRERFALLEDAEGLNLEPLYESGLIFDVDDIAGTGFISDGSVIEYEVPSEYDIDQCTFTIRIGISVAVDEAGGVVAQPAVKIDCLCVRRPLMSELILKAGKRRGTVSVESLGSTLSGAKSIESGIAPLDESALAALAGADEAGELKLRVTGKYQSFDVSVTPEQARSLAVVGQVAQAMLGE